MTNMNTVTAKNAKAREGKSGMNVNHEFPHPSRESASGGGCLGNIRYGFSSRAFASFAVKRAC